MDYNQLHETNLDDVVVADDEIRVVVYNLVDVQVAVDEHQVVDDGNKVMEEIVEYEDEEEKTGAIQGKWYTIQLIFLLILLLI